MSTEQAWCTRRVLTEKWCRWSDSGPERHELLRKIADFVWHARLSDSRGDFTFAIRDTRLADSQQTRWNAFLSITAAGPSFLEAARSSNVYRLRKHYRPVRRQKVLVGSPTNSGPLNCWFGGVAWGCCCWGNHFANGGRKCFPCAPGLDRGNVSRRHCRGQGHDDQDLAGWTL